MPQNTFGAVDRDPRERVVSVAHYALVKLSNHHAKAATDAAHAEWFPAARPPALAFDHAALTFSHADLSSALAGHHGVPRAMWRKLRDKKNLKNGLKRI